MSFLAILLTAGVALAAEPGQPVSDEPRDVVMVDHLDPAAWPHDPVWIHHAGLDRDVLTLGVSFAGGCGQHRFDLVVAKRFLESEPPRLDALLSHDAGSDTCRSLIPRSLRFDLGPLKRHCRETFPEGRGTVVLLLDRLELEIPY